MATLDTIGDASTVAYMQSTHPLKSDLDVHAAVSTSVMHNPLDVPRFSRDVMTEGAHVGHKDGKNTRLTAGLIPAHTVQTANAGNRNHASPFRDSVLGGQLPQFRQFSDVQHGPDTLIRPDQSMKRAVTLLDPVHPINAMPSRNFESGGTETNNDPVSFIGNNMSVPTISANDLTKNPGTDFTFYTNGPVDFKRFDKMAKKEFMKRMAERVLDYSK
jgi:hypothetical protein